MAELTAGFETGSNGNNVLTSDSGNANAWDVRSVTGGSIVYDNSVAYAGNLSGKWTFGGSAAATNMQWTTAFGTQTDHYGRVYLYLTSFRTSNFAELVGAYSGATFAAGWVYDGSGIIFALDSGGGFSGGTVPVSLNTWIRVEWHFTHNVATGLIEVKLFNSPSSTSPSDTVTFSNRNTLASADGIRFGSSASGAATDVIRMDGILANATAYPGPLVVSTQNLAPPLYTSGHGAC